MGGAAGHMAHPFDLSWVNSGSDLLDFFDRAKTLVEKKGAGAVKIDGVNVSFKVVGDDEVKQFAVDRGSLKTIDIEGITMRRVDERFPEGHGMRPAIKSLLTILNAAIKEIQPELRKLGMWDDPSRFLNTEYVEGTTNVTQYDDNFLAIHGLNQFYHRIGKSGASKDNERPGINRPPGTKAASVEMPHEPAIMKGLVEKLTPYAERHGFKVYSSVPTERIKNIDIDYSEVLSEPFAVRISDDREITKSLGEWLQEATNPRYKTVKLKNGKRTHPLHKQLYIDVLNRSTPIVDLIDDADAEAVIYGAIFMHATRMLGNEVLKGLTSPMGDVVAHEGVVLRNDKLFGPNPVKITGEFIVGNMGGEFGKLEEVELDAVDITDPDPIGSGAGTDTIAIVPGAFKPPHLGHVRMVEHYASEADKVIVLISNPLKNQRTLADGTVISASVSKQIWELLIAHLPNVEVKISDSASPITATYGFIGKNGPVKPGSEIILGVCTKGNDIARYKQVSRYVKEGVVIRSIEACAVAPAQHSAEYMFLLGNSPLGEEMPSVLAHEKDPRNFHASDMRYLLGKATEDEEAVELLEDFIGDPDKIDDVLSILNIDTGATMPIDEISSASGGAAPFGLSTWGSKKKKERQNKYIDTSLVNEVYKLIIERGIIQ